MSFFLACLLPITTPTCPVPKIVWNFKMPTKNSLYLDCFGLLIIGGNGWVFSTLELLQKKLNKDTFAVVGKVFDEQLTFQMFTWVESLTANVKKVQVLIQTQTLNPFVGKAFKYLQFSFPFFFFQGWLHPPINWLIFVNALRGWKTLS